MGQPVKKFSDAGLAAWCEVLNEDDAYGVRSMLCVFCGGDYDCDVGAYDSCLACPDCQAAYDAGDETNPDAAYPTHYAPDDC